MKKHLCFVVLAGVALASCVKNEVADHELNKRVISFDSPVLYTNQETKANVYGEIGSHQYEGSSVIYTYPREESFVIYAVEHAGNLSTWDSATKAEFNGQAIIYDSRLDAWAPKKSGAYYYWPEDALMSFAAYSPADLDVAGANVTYGSAGLKIEGFEVNPDPAHQYDLLYAKRSVNKSAESMGIGAAYYSGIPIQFQHALSSIHFSLLTDNSVTQKVTLTKIEVLNAKYQGTFEEMITNEVVYASSPKWTPVAGAGNMANYTPFTGSVEFPYTAQYVSALAAKDDDSIDGITDNSHPLLLMPQDLSDDVKIKIYYTVGSEPKTKTIQVNQYPKGGSAITKWEPGTMYTYRMYYSASSEKKDIIYFAPETAPWATAEIIEIAL